VGSGIKTGWFYRPFLCSEGAMRPSGALFIVALPLNEFDFDFEFDFKGFSPQTTAQ
jgi:hypothetical protein